MKVVVNPLCESGTGGRGGEVGGGGYYLFDEVFAADITASNTNLEFVEWRRLVSCMLGDIASARAAL